MAIFQKSVINKHLSLLDKSQVDAAYKKFKENYSPQIIARIKSLKEEEYQDGFLRDIFVDVLGYTLKPDENHDLEREFKNQTDSKKADGAIVKDEKAIVVIELKSTKTRDLKNVTQQAFNYKNNQPECKYVITSNFQKLRFYIDHANEFEEFDLFHLSREEFELFYLILNKDSIFADIPLALKTETKFHDQEISGKLYKDYSSFKRKLFENLVKNNSEADKLTLFIKSQKLLDRFLFILFAEDSGLLPPNSISRIVEHFHKLEELDAYKPIYEILKQYFGYMNIGRKGKNSPVDDIPAYNGGLFYADELLDNLKIDDDILIDDLLNLSEYDFNTDIDVNILGHIFEHSLSEIEEITAEIEGTAPDKAKSKRKKDGVFYTPKYITAYIVENTIGTLCDEKRKELGIGEIEFDEAYRTKADKLTVKGKKLYQQFMDYKDWLISLKIVDPACGSGAFLNQALNYLIQEHKDIDDFIAELTNTLLPIFDIDKTILENNLYGVDINEESIEIAKLSLWLRTAQKGRKLSNLNGNIKCGNSLISDKEVAGDKAFDWNIEFKDIMDNGGFDVVIGNPPYGAKVSKDELKILVERHNNKGLSNTLSDTYIAFYIKSLDEILMPEGMLGFITPNTWRLILSGKEFRDFVSKGIYSFQEIIQHQEKVFVDATVDCDTLLIKKHKNERNVINISIKDNYKVLLSHRIKQSKLAKQDFFNLFLTEKIYNLKQKIESQSVFVKDELVIKNGVKPYEKGKGKPAQTSEIMREKPFTSQVKNNETFVPLIGGSSFHRYKILWNNDFWIQYGEWLAAPRDKEIFLAPEKLIFRQTGDSIIGSLVDSKYIMRDNTHIVLKKNDAYDLKYILAILNSKLSNLIYWTNNPEKGEAMAQIKLFHLGLCVFKDIQKYQQQPFIQSVNMILGLNKKFLKNKIKFLNRMQDNFEIEKMSKKLNAFYDFDFKTFVAELKKKKINLSLVQQDEWEEYFTTYKTQINQLQAEIQQTDNEIDQMVYKLYDLTKEEIDIVEGVNEKN